MKDILQKLFIAIAIILFFLSGCARKPTTSSTKNISNIQIKYLLQDNNKNLYQVTCNDGKQHTILFNPAEQDFQYYSPNKGDYIKYNNIEFKDLIFFGRWVCRNK